MTLADSVKPKTFVFTYLLTRLPFQHITRILTEIPFYIIIVLDLPQKTDALGILPFASRKSVPGNQSDPSRGQDWW